MAGPDLVEVRISAPDRATADAIASGLVERHLAACAQVLPGITSTYHWQGETETADEVLILVKTAADKFEAICEFVGAEHPYETPEILAVPIAQASHGYAAWLADSLIEP